MLVGDVIIMGCFGSLSSNVIITMSDQEVGNVPLYSTFYLCNYAVFVIIIFLHGCKRFLNRRATPHDGHTGVLESESLTELGYRRTILGTALQVVAIAWMVWMEVGMLMLAIGNYYGFWPFGNVGFTPSWDSYTAGFLIAWVVSTFLLMMSIRYSKALRLLYLEPCQLRFADYVMMRSHSVDDSGIVSDHAELCGVKSTAGSSVRWVAYQLSRYTWVEEAAVFTSISIFNPEGPTAREIFAVKAGRTASEADGFLTVDGKNEIDVPVPPFLTALGRELFNYFYVYQLAAAWLPIFWEYITYGIVLLILSLASAIAKVFTERRQRFELRDMARVTGNVWVKRDDEWQRLTSDLLVQGDLIALMDEDADDSDYEVGLLSVDAMIISGNAVCDESLLTGETMPIQKFEVPSIDDEPEVMDIPRDPRTENKKHYVFAGTKLLSASGASKIDLPESSTGKGCLLIVTHRASDSLRGRLLRTLLFGAPVSATWIREIWTVLIILFVLGIIDFIILNAKYDFNLGSILNACTAVIGMISPLLSIAILGGQLASAARLRAGNAKKKRIPLLWRCRSRRIETEEAFKSCDDEEEGDIGGNLRVHCRDVARLTLTGRVTQMCFDKTGTLTKTGLDFLGIVNFEEAESLVLPHMVYFGRRNQEGHIDGSMAVGLALTQTVSVLPENELIGSQVELRMVEAAKVLGWEYDADLKTAREPNGGRRWRVDKQHTFDHHSMTMSVVVTDQGSGESYVFCKGSHEAILDRCGSIGEALRSKAMLTAEKYASQGCYVLGIATRRVSGNEGLTLSRHELEDDLELLGLLLFRNEVKPDSARYIDVLKTGGVDNVMITGDSVYNGAAVARKVGIIPHGYRVVIGDVVSSREVRWADLETQEEVDEESFFGKGSADEGRPTSLCVTGACFSELARENRLVSFIGCRGTCDNSRLRPGVRRPGLVDCSCARIRVFGRMTPHQKVSVITAYSRPPLNLITGMCGDGGNDSGALRAAAAGLALSGRVEASVAAPFSTDSPSIGSLVLLLREARASMCTSFASYRFLVVRGVIGSIGKMILMLYAGAYLTPFGFIYQDLVMNPLLLWALSMSKPSKTLARVPPEGSLLGPMMVMSASLTIIIGVIFLLAAFFILFSNDGEEWFARFDGSNSEVREWQKRSDNFEAALTWLWLSWITFDTAVCYSYGDVHRRPVYRNLTLVFVVLLTGTPLLVLLLASSSQFSCAFKVNCSLSDFQAVQYSWINWFLFPYEEVGGDVWYGEVPGNVMPVWLRWTYFGLFSGMTIAHHLSYKLICLGSVVRRTLPGMGWGAREVSPGFVRPYSRRTIFNRRGHNHCIDWGRSTRSLLGSSG